MYVGRDFGIARHVEAFEEHHDVCLASFSPQRWGCGGCGGLRRAAAGCGGWRRRSSRAVARCLILVPRLCPARLSDGCSRAPVRRRAPATTRHLSSAVRALPDRFVAAQSPARRCERCCRLCPQTEAWTGQYPYTSHPLYQRGGGEQWWWRRREPLQVLAARTATPERCRRKALEWGSATGASVCSLTRHANAALLLASMWSLRGVARYT